MSIAMELQDEIDQLPGIYIAQPISVMQERICYCTNGWSIPVRCAKDYDIVSQSSVLLTSILLIEVDKL
jgi:hypothetical protein